MCGVSRSAVCSLIKSGILVRQGRLLDTDNTRNRQYLEKHRKTEIVPEKAEFDIFATEEEDFTVYTHEGEVAMQACKTLMRYIASKEQEIAIYKNVEKPVPDVGAENFMRFLIQKLQLNDMDEQMTHDGILMAMKPEYRIAYLHSLAETRT